MDECVLPFFLFDLLYNSAGQARSGVIMLPSVVSTKFGTIAIFFLTSQIRSNRSVYVQFHFPYVLTYAAKYLYCMFFIHYKSYRATLHSWICFSLVFSIYVTLSHYRFWFCHMKDDNMLRRERKSSSGAWGMHLVLYCPNGIFTWTWT